MHTEMEEELIAEDLKMLAGALIILACVFLDLRTGEQREVVTKLQ